MIAGRKSDIKDCRSLASLHSKGALEERGGFVPPSDTRRLQDYVRLRQNHVTAAGRETQHKQKALESMNLKPRDVIRTLTGMSGMNMIRAIVEGERDPAVLVELCVDRVRWAKPEKLKDALTGTWKERERNAVPSLVAQQRQ